MEFNSEIKFRKCLNSEEDKRRIFEWSNDQEVRKNSFNTNPIKYEDHDRWFASKINLEDYFILFFMVDNKEVGLVRLDVQDGKAEISYQISKDYRGMGYGKQMLKFLECYVKENDIASILLGEVKFSNISSQRIFEGLNYKKITKNNNLVYIKELKRINYE